jgi:hypothetical protein
MKKNLIQCLLGLALGAAMTLISPTTTLASVNGGAMSQLEYLQWMVKMVGDTPQFNANSTAEDYINWAKVKGMTPSTGWQPGQTLTRSILAQTLVQLLHLNPRQFGGDYARILEREGIILPSDDNITRIEFTRILADNDAPHFPHGGPSPHKHPNNGKGNGDQPPPPHNPNGNPQDGDHGHNGHHNH